MLHDEIFYTYFNESQNTIGIGTFLGLEIPEYPVGKALFDFIELDLQEYNNYRILINNLLDDCFLKEKKAKYVKEIEKLISRVYANATNLKKRRNKPQTFKELIKNGDMGSFMMNISEKIGNHPYCHFCIAEERDLLDEYGLDLLFYQEHFKELIEFCLDQSYNPLLNQLTAEQRYFLWKQKNLNPMFPVEQSNINSRTNTVLLSPNNSLKNSDSIIHSNEITQETIDIIKATPIIPVQLYYCNTPIQYAICEFNALIKINAKVKKCKHCGKYFILKGDYATEYCDRIIDGEKFTCKKIAAIQTRKNKIKQNPILKEYERAYKRNYARVTNHKMTSEDFRLWTEEATQKRNETSIQYESSPSDDIITEFKKYLGNK